MDLDTVLLARIQFAANISFHILFPTITIALGWILLFFKLRYAATRDEAWMDAYRLYVKVFALTFALGVVSGITMSFQVGTNWPGFMERVGNIAGPLLAYEMLTAFFLEAGFLGVMLFGMKKVGPRLHLLATAMVALGTLISATWIVDANSWMHTPAGFAINAQGQFVPAGSWWPIIFNPSFPYRVVHTVIGAYLTTSLVVGAVGAWHLLRDAGDAHARKMFSMAMWMAALVAPVQIFAGDTQGLNTLQYEPAKIAAMEGHFDSHPHGAPLVLFGIPDPARHRMDHAIEVPKLSSLILKHDLNAPLAGLDAFPANRVPPVSILFWSFRLMVGLGFAMLGLGLWSLWARWRGTLFENRWLQRAAILMGPSGFVAVLAGWVTTEVGRQPWTVYGHLLTAQSHSPLAAPAVAASLTAFVLVYFAAFGAGTWYILRLMARSPDAGEPEPAHMPVRAAGITPAPGVDADGPKVEVHA